MTVQNLVFYAENDYIIKKYISSNTRLNLKSHIILKNRSFTKYHKVNFDILSFMWYIINKKCLRNARLLPS